MSILAGDILRVVATLVWLDGNLNQNVFNAVVTGGGSPFADADIVDDAVTWVGDMYAHLVTLMSDEVDGSQVQVYVYDSGDDDWDEVGTDPWVYDPSSVSDQLPRGVAALINANTLDPDVQGKKYIGGMVEGNIADGLWESGLVTALGLFAAEWLAGFTGGTSGATWAPGIWSPTGTNFHASNGAFITPTIPAYQRRRKRGVGI